MYENIWLLVSFFSFLLVSLNDFFQTLYRNSSVACSFIFPSQTPHPSSESITCCSSEIRVCWQIQWTFSPLILEVNQYLRPSRIFFSFRKRNMTQARYAPWHDLFICKECSWLLELQMRQQQTVKSPVAHRIRVCSADHFRATWRSAALQPIVSWVCSFLCPKPPPRTCHAVLVPIRLQLG